MLSGHALRYVSRLRSAVRSKLGFAFGSGPDLAGMNSPSGASPVQQARLASTLQASSSGRSDRACKVSQLHFRALASDKESHQMLLLRSVLPLRQSLPVCAVWLLRYAVLGWAVLHY